VQVHDSLDVQLQPANVLDQIDGERRRRGKGLGAGPWMKRIGLHQ